MKVGEEVELLTLSETTTNCRGKSRSKGQAKAKGQAKGQAKAKGLAQGIVLMVLILLTTAVLVGGADKGNAAEATATNQPTENGAEEFWSSADLVNKLIRFHVVGNSDSEVDQALKRAVRDAILVKVSPELAKSQSLEESRLLLEGLRPEMENIARSIVRDLGNNEQIRSDYGRFQFPTKSYGSIVLPAGEYEAVRILIGEAEGGNWWCVLFPPLCFVNIEHSTAIPVDGKPAIPLQKSANSNKKVVRFWFWEKATKLMNNSL